MSRFSPFTRITNSLMNHTEINEDWEKRLDEQFEEVILDQEVRTVLPGIKHFIRSLRQSDKELILGKMKKIIESCWCDDSDCFAARSGGIGCGKSYNMGIDTCKSIVEEVMR